MVFRIIEADWSEISWQRPTAGCNWSSFPPIHRNSTRSSTYGATESNMNCRTSARRICGNLVNMPEKLCAGCALGRHSLPHTGNRRDYSIVTILCGTNRTPTISISMCVPKSSQYPPNIPNYFSRKNLRRKSSAIARMSSSKYFEYFGLSSPR